jgi:pyruvate/2-oxoglutarate dehydrogenase complex dihydrolipoamide acyltransferase (E2) component
LASLEHSPQFFRQVLEQADRMTEAADETGGVSEPAAGRETEEREEPEATKAARKKAEELGMDLSGLEGTGSGGRIVVRDVIKAARG